jgi:V8-like Glu-specific endopeptidase
MRAIARLADGGRRRTLTVLAVVGVLALIAAVSLLSGRSASGSSASGTGRSQSAAAGVPVLQFGQSMATGQAFDGVPAVGALFTEVNGQLGTHFCTASVVHSTAGDLVVTAAHCVSGRSGPVAFVPGYANGHAPYGIWLVSHVYTDSAWQATANPDDDVAFLRLANSSNGAPIEDVTGAEQLGIGTAPGQTVRVIGYPDGADQPVWCDGVAKSFTATQLVFDCGGYPDGTSGGPFLADVNTATGRGTIVGVIGGYEQGGDTPSVSYAATFGSAVAALYATAEAGD